MSLSEQLSEDKADRVARRGYIAKEDVPRLQTAPRRMQAAELVPPGFGFDHFPIIRENPRRRAPMRALLDRWLLGRGEGGPKRGLVDPNQLLASQLVKLAHLDPRWGFLQAARPTPNGTEIDHWVVGPGGIYLLNAKFLPGSKLHISGDQFLVDGHERPYVDEIRGELNSKALKFSSSMHWDADPTGVIVPMHDRRLVVESFPQQVAILGESDLTNWLVNRPEQLGKKQILTAFGVARDLTLQPPKFSR